MASNAEKIVTLTEQLKVDRINWDSVWQDLSDHLLPRLNRFTLRQSKGVEKDSSIIFDSYPSNALHNLASALHAMLTNPATPWFFLKINGDTDNEGVSKPIKQWLETTQSRMMTIFNQSNFNTEVYELYLYLIVFGTGVMFIHRTEKNVLHFKTIHLNECLIRTSFDGYVDSLFRVYSVSPRKLIQQFGIEKVSSDTREAYTSGENKEVDCIHAVFPQDDKSLGEWDKTFPFVSVYIEQETKKILSVSGFDSFPYAVPRWSVAPDEMYGRGIGEIALPDVKTLYAMVKTTLAAAEKTVNPPMMVPDQMIDGVLRLTPGSVNQVRGNSGEIKPLFTPPGLPFSLEFISQKRIQIAQLFLNDQLEMPEQPNMTATEVLQRMEEKMRLLAPILGRIQGEFLKPVIERSYQLLINNDYLMPPPEEVLENGLKVEYQSPIARAQRLHEVNAIQRLMQLVSPLISIDPALFKLIDPIELVRILSDILGVPANVLRSKIDLQKIEEAEAEAMKAQQEIELAQTMIQGEKTMSETQLNNARSGKEAG